MTYPAEVIGIYFDGRTSWVRPVGYRVLQSNNVVAEAMTISLDKPLKWPFGLFFGKTGLRRELRTMVTSTIRGRRLTLIQVVSNVVRIDILQKPGPVDICVLHSRRTVGIGQGCW